jgi:hypothetical protein
MVAAKANFDCGFPTAIARLRLGTRFFGSLRSPLTAALCLGDCRNACRWE